MAASAPRAAVRGVVRHEHALLVLLCLGTAVYWSLQYQPFVLPNNDYYSFERTAQSFARGELPASYRRMPVLPAAMALLAPLLPGPHPELRAALLVNAACSLGLLLALFDFGRRTLGAGALLPVVLVATSIEFHAMGLQPLVEPSYGFFVTAAFALLARRSRWQYALAGLAALSRYEAVLLAPALALANAAFEGQWRRHLTLAGLALVPFAAWTALGALSGAGGGHYLSVMSEMEWRPAWRFVLVYLKEPFAGFYSPRVVLAPLVLAVVGVPVLAGVVRGLREFRRETLAALGYAAATALAVVLFGVTKPRYAFPTEWIPLFYFAAGGLWLAEAAARRGVGRGRGALAAAAAGGALGASAWLWLRLLEAEEHVIPFPVDGAFAAFCTLLAATALLALPAPWGAGSGAAGAPRRHAASRLAPAAWLLVAVVWLVGGGVRGKEAAIAQVYHANRASAVLADWVREALGSDDRLLLLPRTHVYHLTGLPWERFEVFAEMEARDPEALVEEMRRKGLTHVAWTWRGPVDSPHAVFMHRIKRADVAQWFRDGTPVPGFEHVATLPLPPALDVPPVQVYRRAR